MSPCPLCSSLADQEAAYRKYGWEERNVHLPAAADRLVIACDFWPYSTRKLQLRQSPRCATCYLYRSDYEYLANGSEDEELLTRLTAEAAAEYLRVARL